MTSTRRKRSRTIHAASSSAPQRDRSRSRSRSRSPSPIVAHHSSSASSSSHHSAAASPTNSPLRARSNNSTSSSNSTHASTRSPSRRSRHRSSSVRHRPNAAIPPTTTPPTNDELRLQSRHGPRRASVAPSPTASATTTGSSTSSGGTNSPSRKHRKQTSQRSRRRRHNTIVGARAPYTRSSSSSSKSNLVSGTSKSSSSRSHASSPTTPTRHNSSSNSSPSSSSRRSNPTSPASYKTKPFSRVSTEESVDAAEGKRFTTNNNNKRPAHLSRQRSKSQVPTRSRTHSSHYNNSSQSSLTKKSTPSDRSISKWGSRPTIALQKPSMRAMRHNASRSALGRQVSFTTQRKTSLTGSNGGKDSPTISEHSAHSMRSDMSMFSTFSVAPFDSSRLVLSLDATEVAAKKRSVSTKTFFLKIMSLFPTFCKASCIWLIPCILLFVLSVFLLFLFWIPQFLSYLLIHQDGHTNVKHWNRSLFSLYSERLNALAWWNKDLQSSLRTFTYPTSRTGVLDLREQLNFFTGGISHDSQTRYWSHKSFEASQQQDLNSITDTQTLENIEQYFPLDTTRMQQQLDWWKNTNDLSTLDYHTCCTQLAKIQESHRPALQQGNFSMHYDSVSTRIQLMEPYDNIVETVSWLSECFENRWSLFKLTAGTIELSAWISLVHLIRAENDMIIRGTFALTNGSFLNAKDGLDYMALSEQRNFWLDTLVHTIGDSSMKSNLDALLSSSPMEHLRQWNIFLLHYANSSSPDFPSADTTLSLQSSGSAMQVTVPSVLAWFDNGQQVESLWTDFSVSLLQQRHTCLLLTTFVPHATLLFFGLLLCASCSFCLCSQTYICSRNILQPYVKAQREEERVFHRFVPRELLGLINCNDIMDMQLGLFTTSTFCVSFCDVRSFTTLSERLTATQVFQFLNSYLSKIGPTIRRNQGYVAQYLGDGILSLFTEGNRACALRSAIEVQHEVLDFNFLNKSHPFYPQIQVGVGLTIGDDIVIGTMGDSERMAQTILGSAVQQADKLEAMTKLFGAKILVSERVVKDVYESQAFFKIRCVSNIREASSQVVKIYEILDPLLDKEKIITLPLFNQAMEKLYSHDFKRAKELFARARLTCPGDRACIFRGEQCEKMLQPDAEEWDGIDDL